MSPPSVTVSVQVQKVALWAKLQPSHIFPPGMATTLSPLIKQGWVRNYLDNVILWPSDFDTLFQCFTQSGLKLNFSKCAFSQRQEKFLGHTVSAEGCKPDPSNVEAIRDMKAPTKVREVHHLRGMCGFCRKHIPKFASLQLLSPT